MTRSSWRVGTWTGGDKPEIYRLFMYQKIGTGEGSLDVEYGLGPAKVVASKGILPSEIAAAFTEAKAFLGAAE